MNTKTLYKNEFQAGVGQVRFQPVSGMLLAVANQNVINLLDFKIFTVVKCLQVSFTSHL